MNNPIAAMLYVALMVAVIVGVDLAFFRHHLWPRLTVNIGIVLVFLAFYVHIELRDPDTARQTFALRLVAGRPAGPPPEPPSSMPRV